MQITPFLSSLRAFLAKTKRKLFVLFYAYRDPRTPLAAKIIIFLVIAYACSPVDLIPDFIPVLGLLDDAILLPLGIILSLKLIPEQVLADCERKAATKTRQLRQIGLIGAVFVLSFWLLVLACATVWLYTIIVKLRS